MALAVGSATPYPIRSPTAKYLFGEVSILEAEGQAQAEGQDIHLAHRPELGLLGAVDELQNGLPGRLAPGLDDREAVVGPVERLWLSANHLTLGLEVARQAVHEHIIGIAQGAVDIKTQPLNTCWIKWHLLASKSQA